MSIFKKFKSSLLCRPLAWILAAVLVFAAIPGSLLIHAYNKTADSNFTESLLEEAPETGWREYAANDQRALLKLQGEWDDAAVTNKSAPASITIAFEGSGITLKTTRTDRMTASVDGSIPLVVSTDDAQYYTATDLEEGVLHTLTVSFAGIDSNLETVYLYGFGRTLFDANAVEYRTASVDGFEDLNNWEINSNKYELSAAEKTEGENALKAATTAARPTLTALYGNVVQTDKAAKGLQFMLHVGDVSNILNITVQLANSEAPSKTGWLWQYGSEQLMEGWNNVSLPFAGATEQKSTAPDMVYDHFAIYVTAKEGTVLFLDDVVCFYQTVSLTTPQLIKPTYETLDHVVAVANVLDYGADPTGQEDSTVAIRAAIAAAKSVGGGTVWMPKGSYLVTDSVEVTEHVTLRGDYNDPDAGDFNGDYGTVILAQPKSQELTEVGKAFKNQGGLFVIKSSAGVKGLTVYYPQQDIKNVKPYTYTFYVPGTSVSNVENCTVINGYRGIGGTGNDKVTVKNFKGTFLKEGIHYIMSTDIGSFVNVDLNPSYWANASAVGMKSAAEKDIVAWSKAHNSAGMTLHDLEQAQYVNINISGYAKGILFPATPTRFMGSGPIFELYIDDCTYGIYAESGSWTSVTGYVTDRWPNLTSIDYRCGYNITKGQIQGDKYSVYNASSEVDVHGTMMKGYVRLSDVKLSGATQGYVFETPNGQDDLSAYSVDLNRQVKSTGTAFESVAVGATEVEIQAALDKVGAAGGGVVYVSAGNYQIKGYLNVPANTELRGAAGCAHNFATGGTVLFVELEASASQAAAQQMPAFISLNGDGAGVTGFYIAYLSNMKLMLEEHSFQYYNYVINGNQHKDVFVYNCAIMGGSRGINFEACDYHVIENVFSHCTFETARVGGKDGLVLDCLANGGYMTLNGGAIEFSASAESMEYLRNIPYENFVHINVVNAENQQMVNFFAFMIKGLVRFENSTNTLAVNACSDGVSGDVYTYSGGSCTVLNGILTSGNDYKNDGCKLKVYNFMSLDPSHKVDLKENIG